MGRRYNRLSIHSTKITQEIAQCTWNNYSNVKANEHPSSNRSRFQYSLLENLLLSHHPVICQHKYLPYLRPSGSPRRQKNGSPGHCRGNVEAYVFRASGTYLHPSNSFLPPPFQTVLSTIVSNNKAASTNVFASTKLTTAAFMADN